MYDEVMQLIALAKNDKLYFERIEDLKQKQLEYAHVLDIANTLSQADMHMSKAKQDAEKILKEAEKEAAEIKATATSIIAEHKALVEKNKALEVTLKQKLKDFEFKEREVLAVKETLKESIEYHRNLTNERALEQEVARKIKLEFTEKLRKIKEIANQTT